MLWWNGQPRPTTVVDSSRLVAQIGPADVAGSGRAAVLVFTPAAGAGASNSVAVNIGPPPAATTDSFVNAAGGPFGNAVAPGSIASLFGANLSGDTLVADGPLPLPRTLGGTVLSFGYNVQSPLFFVSPSQVNFQVPYYPGLKGRTTVPITISHAGQSTTTKLTMQPYAPAIFTTNGQGTGQASALIAGTTSVAAGLGVFPGSRPARRGEYIALFATGLGDCDNAPNLGVASPTDPLAVTLQIPTVTLGGIALDSADVLFSGLAPGLVGVNQINFQIPARAPTGAAVPVTLTIGGVQSNVATIAIE